ncbi:hypothetical protein SDJN03_19256, partial [Cucurbita argyrosperma subsp. sororia]
MGERGLPLWSRFELGHHCGPIWASTIRRQIWASTVGRPIRRGLQIGRLVWSGPPQSADFGCASTVGRPIWASTVGRFWAYTMGRFGPPLWAGRFGLQLSAALGLH